MNCEPDSADDGKTGFNLNTQILHCLVVLNDQLAPVMSSEAGNAFFRAFIVEDRKSGKILANMRLRYKYGDSWFRLKIGPDKQHLSREERIKYLAEGIAGVQGRLLEIVSGGVPPPKDAVICFYPPEPEDADKTFDWLIAQDLIEVKEVTSNGQTVPIAGGGSA
jgi:hypothetical protein